jgi:RNA polymerase sigma-70 factor (ECF subfamily)
MIGPAGGDTVPSMPLDGVKTCARADAKDADSRPWLEELRDGGRTRDDAVARLHGLLLRAARFEISRRRGALRHAHSGEREDLAQQSANDALVAVLSKLGDFRGESRFTTWAYKFALYESSVTVRRRAWQERELPLEPGRWRQVACRLASPEDDAAGGELLAAVQNAIADALSPHQREVLVAITLNCIPIDVLADRLNTTRGALYKTLHDARRNLRRRLAPDGFDVSDIGRSQG